MNFCEKGLNPFCYLETCSFETLIKITLCVMLILQKMYGGGLVMCFTRVRNVERPLSHIAHFLLS